MSEFLPPRMHEAESDQGAHEQAPVPIAPIPFQPPAQVPAPAAPSEPPPAGPPSQLAVPPAAVPTDIRSTPAATTAAGPRTKPWRPGPLGRLVSLIITVGLAWALTVAITAWLLGLFLARG